MERLKLGIKFSLFLSLCLWMVGCQQPYPQQSLARINSSNQFSQQSSQQFSPANYSNLFSNSSSSTVSPPNGDSSTQIVQPPQAEATSCSRYTAPTQQFISACGPILIQYQAALYEEAPSCAQNFQAITPNSACTTLVPQLNNMISGCRIVFTDYQSYLGVNCLESLKRLLNS